MVCDTKEKQNRKKNPKNFDVYELNMCSIIRLLHKGQGKRQA